MDSARPWIATAVFWGGLAATLVDVAVRTAGGASWRFAAGSAVAVAAVVAAWSALRWGPPADGRARLAAAAFLAATFLLGLATGLRWSLLLYPVVFLHAMVAFGLRGGRWLGLPVLLALALNAAVSWQPLRLDVDGGLLLLVPVALAVAIAVIGAAFAEVARRGEQAQELLVRLRASSDRVRELALAEERARLARELHDSLGHSLTVINLQLQTAQRYRRARPDEAWDEVEQARALTLAALGEVRRSVRALKPAALEGGSQVDALRALATASAAAGLHVDVTVRGSERPLPDEVGLVLYRALQEALTNAARHAGARSVAVTLELGGEEVRLTVADDGRGSGGAGVGFGLSALRERAAALGGTLTAADGPAGGFVVDLAVPLATAVRP
jgi:signal transduction histidine kinase